MLIQAGNNAGDPYILCQNQTSTKFQITSDGDIFTTGAIYLNGETGVTDFTTIRKHLDTSIITRISVLLLKQVYIQKLVN